MRILFVVTRPPVPTGSGAAMRLSMCGHALGALGEVDLCVFARHRHREADNSYTTAFQRSLFVLAPEQQRSWKHRARWFASRQLPLEIAGRDYSQARAQLRPWLAASYDIAWFERCPTYAAFHDLVQARKFVDVDDLEDEMALGRLRNETVDLTRLGGLGRRLLRQAVTRRNCALWRKFHATIARDGTIPIVCSELDRTRINAANAAVIPNGYPAPAQPCGREAVSEPPTFLFHGSMVYDANIDAVRHLCESIAPRLGKLLPGANIRIVGRHDQRLERLPLPDNVQIVGWVDRIEDELSRSDLIVCPLRFGSGTRIKILEAFAHQIPVVSTRLGAEGLDVKHEKHLLIADDPDAFAAACVRLAKDMPLRRTLNLAANALFRQQYAEKTIQRRIQQLVTNGNAVG